METHDPAGGREETIEGGVVLRFPGDWVGPLEELVPFGPAADRDTSAPAPDFWGEDSAVLQDAVEAPKPPRPPRYGSLRIRRWLPAAGAVLAAALFAVAAILGGSTSTAPHVHGVTFAIASIPPLAPAATAVKKRPTRHPVARPRSRPRSAPRPAVSTGASTVSSSPTTPSPTYHPAAAPSGSAGNSSTQSGGAFTLGGP